MDQECVEQKHGTGPLHQEEACGLPGNPWITSIEKGFLNTFQEHGKQKEGEQKTQVFSAVIDAAYKGGQQGQALDAGRGECAWKWSHVFDYELIGFQGLYSRDIHARGR